MGDRQAIGGGRQQAAQGILRDAAAVANATARTLFFQPRDPGAYVYDDGGHWKTAFIGGDYRWLIDDGEGGRNLDARTYFFYMATVNTPAMVNKMVGKGSQYALAYTDKDGNYLDGIRTWDEEDAQGIGVSSY